ncbi:MAG: OadG family protein [Clostridiales bacterium]|nr:OadG family protein [Clostridiales bacterium]
MSIADSLLVALILISIVFMGLIALYILVRIEAYIISLIGKKEQVEVSKQPSVSSNVEEVSEGELTLIGVDEETAAMIMAITSDELKIPLNELRFISIKALD